MGGTLVVLVCSRVTSFWSIQQLLMLKGIFFITKRAILMRRSTVLSLPLQLVFLDFDYHAAAFHHNVFDRLDAPLIDHWLLDVFKAI